MRNQTRRTRSGRDGVFVTLLLWRKSHAAAAAERAPRHRSIHLVRRVRGWRRGHRRARRRSNKSPPPPRSRAGPRVRYYRFEERTREAVARAECTTLCVYALRYARTHARTHRRAKYYETHAASLSARAG